MLTLIDKILILPAHLWVWILNHNLIPASVWDRLMVWRAKK